MDGNPSAFLNNNFKNLSGKLPALAGTTVRPHGR
jgi:hypothetical protein